MYLLIIHRGESFFFRELTYWFQRKLFLDNSLFMNYSFRPWMKQLNDGLHILHWNLIAPHKSAPEWIVRWENWWEWLTNSKLMHSEWGERAITSEVCSYHYLFALLIFRYHWLWWTVENSFVSPGDFSLHIDGFSHMNSLATDRQ